MTTQAHNPSHGNHGTLKSYIIGFILSLILTIVPYMIVVNHVLTVNTIIIAIVILGIVQLLVQLKFFLHLSTARDERDTLLSFVFIFIVVGILVVGSLWIMWSMNYNMMPHAAPAN